MKFLYLIIFSVFFISCKNQEVKIPVNDNPGLHEVWDNSPIYILMKIKGKDTIADVKLGQTMSTTQWLVAADRRLNLKQIRPALDKILAKRHKKSIHSDGTAHAYFTYLDSVQNKVSFIDFDSIQLMPDFYTSQQYFKEYPKADTDLARFHLTITPNKIVLNDSLLLPLQKMQLQDSLWNYVAAQTGTKENSLYLNFPESMSFDRFVDWYTFFKKNMIPKGKLNPKIFIFTL